MAHRNTKQPLFIVSGGAILLAIASILVLRLLLAPIGSGACILHGKDQCRNQRMLQGKFSRISASPHHDTRSLPTPTRAPVPSPTLTDILTQTPAASHSATPIPLRMRFPVSNGSGMTFFIRGGTDSDVTDVNGHEILRPRKTPGGGDIFRLDVSVNGKTAELPVGAFISLKLPGRACKLAVSADNGVVDYPKFGGRVHGSDIVLLKVIGQGDAAIFCS